MSDEAVLERLRAAVPENVRVVCETLSSAGHQAVTVGGAVRDAILGREPAFDALRSAPRFQRLLEKIGPPEALARSGSVAAPGSRNR